MRILHVSLLTRNLLVETRENYLMEINNSSIVPSEMTQSFIIIINIKLLKPINFSNNIALLSLQFASQYLKQILRKSFARWDKRKLFDGNE